MSIAIRRVDTEGNASHWAYPYLSFAWRGGRRGDQFVQNTVRGREVLASVSSPVVHSIDGFGLSTTAADERWSSVVRTPALFADGVTIMWRGVLLGTPGATNYGNILGVNYGSGAGSPYSVFNLCRRHGFPDHITLLSNDGAAFISASTDVSLSSLYSIPIVIAVSNAKGAATSACVIASPSRGFISQPTLNSFGVGSGRLTSATDIVIIGENNGAGRYPNCITTGAAIWNIALSAAQLRSVAMQSDDVFISPSRIMAASLMDNSGVPLQNGLLRSIQHNGAFI